MTGINSESNSAGASSELSDEERSAVFAAANARGNRTKAFNEGRISIPPKALAWTVAAILFLSIGGVIGQHYFPSFSGKTTTTSIMKPTLSTPTTTDPLAPNSLTSLQAFMGLKFISNASAKDFTLTTPSGKSWNLASQKGKVVVLTFYNANCQDICPVLGAEINQASQQLGHNRSRVEFVVVNTDPRLTRVSSTSPALELPGITNLKTVTFLTGTLRRLNSVWSSYGIFIKVGAKANQISHNNVVYFVGPHGNLAALSIPFAQEDSSGIFSLSPAAQSRYAEGIAATAGSLFQ